MKARFKRITSELKKYDRELYCGELPSGVPAIFRRTVRQEVYDLNDEDHSQLTVFKDAPHLVFSLTDNWNVAGAIVDWGIEPILARLKAMDLWQNPKFVESLIDSNEKIQAGQTKDRRNNTESFLYELRDKFKKDWKDINTSNVAKKDKRYETDKRIKGDL